jgi:hypothetical protein
MMHTVRLRLGGLAKIKASPILPYCRQSRPLSSRRTNSVGDISMLGSRRPTGAHAADDVARPTNWTRILRCSIATVVPV